MQLTQQQLLQQAMSGQITLPPGMSREAVGGFLMKAGLNPNQIQNSQSILNKVRYIFYLYTYASNQIQLYKTVLCESVSCSIFRCYIPTK